MTEQYFAILCFVASITKSFIYRINQYKNSAIYQVRQSNRFNKIITTILAQFRSNGLQRKCISLVLISFHKKSEVPL